MSGKSRVALVLAAGLVLVLGRAAGDDKGPSKEPTVEQMTRCTVWRYEAEKGGRGCFLKEGDGWVELIDGKLFARFEETGRNAEYVELHDGGRKLWLRLYADRVLWRQAETEWFLLPVTGHAAREAPVPAREGPESEPRPPVADAAAPGLDGAWRLVSYKPADADEARKVPEGLQMTKLVTGGRFVSVLAKDGKVVQLTGGRCAVEGERYYERAAFVLDGQDEWMVSAPGAFRWRLEGDRWYHEGVIRGRKQEARISEVWERLPAPRGGRKTDLDGAWRCVSYKPPKATDYEEFPEGWESAKLVVGGQFVWTLVKGRKVTRAAGGPCSVTPGEYAETVEFVADGGDEWMLSKPGKFTWKLDGDTWRHAEVFSRERADVLVAEVWKRIK